MVPAVSKTQRGQHKCSESQRECSYTITLHSPSRKALFKHKHLHCSCHKISYDRIIISLTLLSGILKELEPPGFFVLNKRSKLFNIGMLAQLMSVWKQLSNEKETQCKTVENIPPSTQNY